MSLGSGFWRADRAAPQGAPFVRASADRMLDVAVAIWIFSGALVFIEPSPYELMFLVVLGLAIFSGLGIYRSSLPLLAIFLGFVPFSLIAVFQVRVTPLSEALIFTIVTYFLLLTSFVAANYVAEAPVRRVRLIVLAYTGAAVLASLVGLYGYLTASEIFTLYGRARATFKDPNVYGPFLVLPAMYALQRVLLDTGRRSMLAAMIYGILLVGVFVSFSRAAWGHLAASSLLVVLLCFTLESTAREKLRIMVLALVGLGAVVLLIAGLLSIPVFADLFAVRAASQGYDGGETGRFGRQGYAFALALAHPWGLGPLEFFTGPIREQPHNTYVTVFHAYGWGGGALFYVFMFATLWKSMASLATPSRLRPLMIPLAATFPVLALEAAIIDIDHWRHPFLMAGMIWGIASAIRREPAGSGDPKAAIV